MANTTKTYDARYDRSLHSLYRMGFESARVDYTTGRTNIRDYRSDDRELCNLDGSREIRTKKNREGGKMRKYFKRLWCALWNKKCHDDCDCV